MHSDLWHSTRAIVFDAFGTLVDIKDKRHPIRRLIQRCAPQPRALLTHAVMRAPLSWEDMVTTSRLPADAAIAALRVDLNTEIASITATPEARAFWPWLQGTNRPIGLCSNLALPYVAPCQAALPGPISAATWSCHTGFIKPEPAIYLYAAQAVGVPPTEVLFVGDRPTEDRLGPQAVGMKTASIAEFTQWALRQAEKPPYPAA